MFWKKKRPATYWRGELLYTEAEGLCVAKVLKDGEQWAIAFNNWAEKHRFETIDHAKAWAEKNWELAR